MPLFSHPTDIGRLLDPGPYRAWVFRTGAAGIMGAHGRNCWAGDGGAVLLRNQAHAEAVIRAHGHEPGEALRDG